MSQRERDRLVVLRQVAAGDLSVAEGGRRLGVTTRHMRRLVRRFEHDSDRVVVHGLKGRPSNRRLSVRLRERALELARDPLYDDFGPTLLAEHLGRTGEWEAVRPATLRLWLIEEGLWRPRKRGKQHRSRRERKAAFGELVLMDTSIHAWLEARSSEEIVLIALLDDASSRLFCRFFPRDTGVANRSLLVDYLVRFGRMGAVYADRASHFQANFNRTRRAEQDQDPALTLIQRALDALDIRLIRALSPQAKGRVERLFGTLQDRLIKEMRVAGVASLHEANRFLEKQFLPFWERRFTIEPRDGTDAHRPLPRGIDLHRLFADTDRRVIGNDFTFRYLNTFYQIERADADGAMPKSRITIERRLDGALRFRWRERYLLPSPLLGRPAPPSPQAGAQAAKPSSSPPRRPAPADHPWRRAPIVVGKKLYESHARPGRKPLPKSA